MSIKLNGATSGSVELEVPAAVTGGDVSLILPGAGTVDRLERAGNILQVKQAVKTDRSSVTGFVWTDTGLSVNITPTSTASNILVTANIHLGGTSAYDMKLRLVRDTTVIGVGDGDGGRPAVTSILSIYDDVPVTDSYKLAPAGISFLDTVVSTTSSVTYKVQFASYSTYTVYVNRSEAYQTQPATPIGYVGTPISTLTLMEVAG